jgi:capsular exopolysaccharide synthesis family protein
MAELTPLRGPGTLGHVPDGASSVGFSAGLPALDIRAVMSLLTRRRWVILATATALFGTVALYTLRQAKVYGATTSIVIDATPPRFLDNSQVQEVSEPGAGGYWFTKEYTETQTRIITSRAVSQRAVEKLGLQSDPAFLGVSQIQDPRARELAMKAIDAVAVLQGKVNVLPEKDTRIVNVRVEDGDPKRAALLANEVADAYIAENLALRLRVSESANRWLEDRLAELEQRTKQSELAVYDFKKDADMLTTSLEDRASMISQRLNTFNGALTDIRTRIAGLKARVEAINSLKKGPDSSNNPLWADVLTGTGVGVLSALKTRYLQEKAECAAMAERYLPDHPKLATCLQKVSEAREDLVHELDNVVHGAQFDLAEATAKERNLQVLLEAAKAEAFVVNKRQIEFDRIKRESDNNQRLYDLVLKRLKDTELSGMLRTNNVRVLDAARPSLAPLRPNVRNNLLLGLLLGLVGGIGLALLLDQLDNTVKSQADVEEKVGVPFLGVLPHVLPEKGAPAGEQDLYVFRHPKSTAAEACRAVRTNLLFMSPDRPLRTMLITSSGPREGKSASVIATGIVMAQSGNRVLLVDTDMRRPRLHKALGVPNEKGVSSVLVGDATLDEVAKSTEVPGLFLIPSGPVPPNPAELFHTHAFDEFVTLVSSRYDRVIFDSPPVNAVADPVVLATRVDGTVLVIKAGVTHKAMAKRAIRVLNDVKARLFGAVLNDVELRDAKYGDLYAAYASEYHESREGA